MSVCWIGTSSRSSTTLRLELDIDPRLGSDWELRLSWSPRHSSVLDKSCLGEAASVVNRDDPTPASFNFWSSIWLQYRLLQATWMPDDIHCTDKNDYVYYSLTKVRVDCPCFAGGQDRWRSVGKWDSTKKWLTIVASWSVCTIQFLLLGFGRSFTQLAAAVCSILIPQYMHEQMITSNSFRSPPSSLQHYKFAQAQTLTLGFLEYRVTDAGTY